MNKLRRFFAWFCLGLSILILIGWSAWAILLSAACADLTADPATSGIDYLPVYLALGFGSFVSVVFGLLFSGLSALLSRHDSVKLLALILIGIFVAVGFVTIFLIV
jgi:hypothetical protein